MYGGGAMFFPVPGRKPCSGCGGFCNNTHRDMMALCEKCDAVERAGGLQIEAGMRVFLKGSMTAYAVLEITSSFEVLLKQMDANYQPILRRMDDISYRSVWF